MEVDLMEPKELEQIVARALGFKEPKRWARSYQDACDLWQHMVSQGWRVTISDAWDACGGAWVELSKPSRTVRGEDGTWMMCLCKAVVKAES